MEDTGETSRGEVALPVVCRRGTYDPFCGRSLGRVATGPMNRTVKRSLCFWSSSTSIAGVRRFQSCPLGCSHDGFPSLSTRIRAGSTYGRAEDLLPGADPNQGKRAPADILLARLTHEAGKHLTTLMIYTSADVRKVGKDGWIRETVDLSPFTGRTAGERSSPLYLDDVGLKYSRWFARATGKTSEKPQVIVGG